MKCIGWILVVLLLTACTTGSAGSAGATPLPWRLGFFAPNYMEVWVEAARVIDARGDLYPNAGGGVVALGYAGNPSGWPERAGRGSGRYIRGADLPARIYVRWQSLVEPKTYEVTFDVPEQVHRLMRQREPQPQYLPAERMEYRNYVIVGLAPGGIVKVWNSGVGLDPIEVMCLQATVVPEGPYGGRSEGQHRPLTERAALYVQSHPIPYGSWTCGAD